MKYRINTLSQIGQVVFGTDAECNSDELAFLIAGEKLAPGRQAEVRRASDCIGVVTGARGTPAVRRIPGPLAPPKEPVTDVAAD